MSTTPRVDRAAALVDEVTAALVASEIPDALKVEVTLDASAIDRVKDQRLGLIVIEPGPELEFVAPTVIRTTWTLVAVAKAGDLSASWPRLDEIVQALWAGGLQVTKAVPGRVKRPDPAPDVPGYTITLTEDHQYL